MPASQMGAAGSATNFVLPKAGAVTNFTAGETNETGVSTDVAIDGSGFFAVQLPGNLRAYTRDGAFQVSNTGRLVTSQG